MPNFARSDDVNLAYVQANTVVNLAHTLASTIVTKVSGGHNCWLADNNACGQILTTWITNWAECHGRRRPPPRCNWWRRRFKTVGQSLNFPASYVDYQNTVYTLTSKYCVRCHSTTADPAVEQSPYFADPNLVIAYPAAIPKIDFTGCAGSGGNNGGTCGTNSRSLSALADRQPQLLGQLRIRCGADAGADPGIRRDAVTPSNIDPNAGGQRGHHPLRRAPSRAVRAATMPIPSPSTSSNPSSTTRRTTPAVSIRRRI